MDSGNKLDILRHRRDNQSFRQLALLYVCEALAPEPSVRVEDVQRVTFDNPSAVGIRVKFMIIPLYSMDDVVAGPYEETVII